MKLDYNRKKRKRAALQAYCSYAWKSTLRPIVLTRWEQERKTVTFDDDDDPSEDGDAPPEEAHIPLTFKLKIAKELYKQLSPAEKKDIDDRREADKNKMYRKITQIDDDDERHAKLRKHQKYVLSFPLHRELSDALSPSRNQQQIEKSLNRILENLEEETGCVAHLLVASIRPGGSNPIIQKYAPS